MIPPEARLRRAIHLRSPSLVNHVISTNSSTPALVRNHDLSDNGRTSLHLAAQLGLYEIAEVLILHGHEEDGFSRDSDGVSPLMIACQAGADDEDGNAAAMVAIGKMLIQNYPEMIRIRDSNGWNAFHHAARYGTNDLVSHFLSLPRDLIDQSPTPQLEGDGQTDDQTSGSPPTTPPTPSISTHQQSSQADPRARQFAFPPPRKDSLQGATQYRPSIASPKSSRPVSSSTIMPSTHPLIGTVAADGNTALHYAAAFGHFKTLRTLISAGADAGARNAANWRPLDYSASVQVEVHLRTLVREREARDSRGTNSLDSEANNTNEPAQRNMMPSSISFQNKPPQQNENQRHTSPPQQPPPATNLSASAIMQSEGFVGPSKSRGFIGPGQTKSYMTQSETQSPSRLLDPSHGQQSPSRPSRSPVRPFISPPSALPSTSTPPPPNFSLPTSATSQKLSSPSPPIATVTTAAANVGFSRMSDRHAAQRPDPGRFDSKPGGIRLVQRDGSGSSHDEDEPSDGRT